MSLVSAATFRALALPQISGADQDTTLEGILDRADTILATYCGIILASSASRRTFQSQTYVEHLNGHGSRELHLGAVGVSSITSIYDSPDWGYGSSDLVDSGDYVLDAEGQQNTVYLIPTGAHGSFSDQDARVIKATYVAGYADDSAPDDIEHAIVEMAKLLYKGPDRRGLTSRSGKGGSRGLISDVSTRLMIPLEIQQLISPYVLPRAIL